MLDKSGILEKWTNYWLGWQPRFFSLENGILSYYQSEDEVVNGAKSAIRYDTSSAFQILNSL